MTEVAGAALVSEATAYRYFPDLTALLAVALADEWESPEEALGPVADSRDPVERVAFAARYLLEGVAARQTAVRAVMAATISHPDLAHTARPGIRFGLIAEALRPFRGQSDSPAPGRLTQLERDLAVVVSAEALFTLTDLCGLPTDDALASAVRTAETLTRAAFSGAVANTSQVRQRPA